MTIVSMAACSGCGVGVSTNGLLIPVTPGGGGSSIMILGAGTCSTIRCGVSNQATATYSAALSGDQNKSYGGYSIISGGRNNCISINANGGTIGGGKLNEVQTCQGFVGGGYLNKVCSYRGSISGGVCNTTCGACSTIGGGLSNLVRGVYSTIGGGTKNSTYSKGGFIGGGYNNVDQGTGKNSGYNVISGGYGNRHCVNYYSAIGGGFVNIISSNANSNFIGGGVNNKIGDGINASYQNVIGGGVQNQNYSTSNSSILGGSSNYIGYYFSNSHIIGSNITANASNTTFVEYLSKLGGTFSIPHPNPALTSDFMLNHSFVETPTAGDNIYRFTVKADDKGKYNVDLPDYFPYLNGDVQVWVTCADDFGQAFGIYNSESNVISVNTSGPGTYNVLVIGTRIDQYTRTWQGAVTQKPRTPNKCQPWSPGDNGRPNSRG
jgi:hypothetical protein